MTLICAKNLCFSYAERHILQNVSFEISKGELVSVLGPNGCGKTTLLKILLGLYSARYGQVLLEGVELSCINKRELARKIAYVPQVHNASFGYSVLDVAMMGRMPHKSFFSLFSADDEHIALAALERVGIAHLKDEPYTRISGGERQLTLIARALSQGARIFVLDEPLNGLDYGNQIKLLEQLHELCTDGFTFIKSTHFPDHALWVANHVIMLKNGQVHADGSPLDVITGASLYELYGAEVEVRPFADNFHVCIPEKIQSRLCGDMDRLTSLHPVVH